MSKKLVFGGINSIDHGVWITGSGTFSAPERDYETVSVPGRNGDLIIDNGRWRNISVTYPAFIQSDFDARMSAFRALMCSKIGYQRLEDDYHPDEYRLGVFSNGITPSMRQRNKGGEFDITFNCKPQRFLKIGEEPTQILVPDIIATTWYSHYIPVNDAGMSFEAHCPANVQIAVKVSTYDADHVQLDLHEFTCSNGDTQAVTFTAADVYWRVSITGVSAPDDTWLMIRTTTIFDGEPLALDAVFARNWTIVNPTGYITKPMLEYYGQTFPYMGISNYVDGALSSSFIFRTTQTPVNRIWMDCDMQYLYDDDKNNLTSYLFMTTAQSAAGEALTFPEFGEWEIRLQVYSASGVFGANNLIGLLNIYPLWWKL